MRSSLSTSSILLCTGILSSSSEVLAFQSFASSGTATSRSTTHLNLVFGPETIGIAAISAAAGAAARQPEIQKLESELSEARGLLEASKEKMKQKIDELEDKLFQMDREYEGQTAKFQKEYEAQKKKEIERIADKIKTDYQYKLDIEVEKEKSRMLTKKLEEEEFNADQNSKLAAMRMQKEELELAKGKLQAALSKSEEELEKLKSGSNNKSGFWPF